MQFLIDECVGKKLAIGLEKEGYDVLFVGDIMPSASDEEVIKRAEKEGRILITDDKDFGELVFRQGKSAAGVILLRIMTPEKKLRVLVELLKTYNTKNKFVVLTETAVRIRKMRSNRT